MNEEDMKEIMLLLEKAGWQPQLCDTPLPAYEFSKQVSKWDERKAPAAETLKENGNTLKENLKNGKEKGAYQ